MDKLQKLPSFGLYRNATVSGNAIKTMSLKKTISLICCLLLFVWTSHLFIKMDESKPTLVRLLFAASLVAIPLLVGFIFFLFKKKLFHLGFWIGTFLILAFSFYTIVIYTDEGSDFGKETYATIKHFSDNAGFFTRYKSIVVSYEYSDDIKNSGQHIVKNLYRLGSEKPENYYMGKVLIDKNYKVIKEYYNQSVISDSSLLAKDFGKTLEQVLFVEKAQGHLR
jgi:hypothetical protein